jgi:hypothetical protein
MSIYKNLILQMLNCHRRATKSHVFATRDCSGGVREHLELAENGDEDSDITQQSLLEPVAKFLAQNSQIRVAITSTLT